MHSKWVAMYNHIKINSIDLYTIAYPQLFHKAGGGGDTFIIVCMASSLYYN